MLRAVLSLAVVVAVFAFALPKVAGFSDVRDDIRSMSTPTTVLLVVVAVWNLISYAFVLAAATPGLGFPQAVVVTESSTAVANVLPAGGAFGVGMTATMYRSWGLDPAATGLAIVVTGVWNNLAKLALPLLAIVMLASRGTVTAGRISVAAAGIAALGVIVIGIALLVSSDRLARRAGVLSERWATWLRARTHRGPVTGWSDAASAFRVRVVGLLRGRWARLTTFTVISQLSLFLVLLVSLRGVGVSAARVSTVDVFAAYAFVRLFSALPITPGGVGVVELGLTGALVADGGGRDAVVAGVLVFRALTYLVPIVVGAVTYVVWRRRRSWWVEIPGERPVAPG